MIEKDRYSEVINSLQEISNHYENDVMSNAVATLNITKDEFELKVLVVGHFNAGKSSLINKFVNRENLLAEDQGETTAIASELRYSDEEQAYSYNKSNQREKMIAGKVYLPSEYDHLLYYLNAEGLKKIEDFVLVDTPGFDTALEEHTKALTSYLKYGVGFIVVVDVEKGGLDSQTLGYIHEISQYTDHISVLLNKCDKQIPEQVEKVVEQVKFTLEQRGFDYPVYTISKFDADIVEKVCAIVSGIDAQGEYDKAVKKVIISNVKMIREALSVVSENKFLDTYEWDECIRIQERNRELIAKSFERKRKELTDNIDEDVEGILGSVKSVLSGKADSAAIAVGNGNVEGLQAIVMDAVRPVLIREVKGFTAETLREVAHSISFTVRQDVAEEQELDSIVLSVGEKIQGLIESGKFGKEKADTESKKQDSKTGMGGNDFYKLVTAAISLTTEAVAPWMEMIVILLPEIVAGLKSLFGESNHSKIRKQYEAEIIPQVINSLWPTVKDGMQDNVDAIISMFEEEMDNSMDSISQLINDAKNKKNLSEEEYQAFCSMLEKDIAEINQLLEELENE